MDHAEYVGPIPHLKGRKALIRPGIELGKCEVQFDDYGLNRRVPGTGHELMAKGELSHGWHEFNSCDFALCVKIPVMVH